MTGLVLWFSRGLWCKTKNKEHVAICTHKHLWLRLYSLCKYVGFIQRACEMMRKATQSSLQADLWTRASYVRNTERKAFRWRKWPLAVLWLSLSHHRNHSTDRNSDTETQQRKGTLCIGKWWEFFVLSVLFSRCLPQLETVLCSIA